MHVSHQFNTYWENLGLVNNLPLRHIIETDLGVLVGNKGRSIFLYRCDLRPTRPTHKGLSAGLPSEGGRGRALRSGREGAWTQWLSKGDGLPEIINMLHE